MRVRSISVKIHKSPRMDRLQDFIFVISFCCKIKGLLYLMWKKNAEVFLCDDVGGNVRWHAVSSLVRTVEMYGYSVWLHFLMITFTYCLFLKNKKNKNIANMPCSWLFLIHVCVNCSWLLSSIRFQARYNVHHQWAVLGGMRCCWCYCWLVG